MIYEYRERFGEYHIFEWIEGRARKIAIADREADAEAIVDALNLVSNGISPRAQAIVKTEVLLEAVRQASPKRGRPRKAEVKSAV